MEAGLEDFKATNYPHTFSEPARPPFIVVAKCTLAQFLIRWPRLRSSLGWWGMTGIFARCSKLNLCFYIVIDGSELLITFHLGWPPLVVTRVPGCLSDRGERTKIQQSERERTPVRKRRRVREVKR